jgi:1-acyl-sn-glycerol-3-phosphate acyltransferase
MKLTCSFSQTHRKWIRYFLKLIGRLLLPILARIKITGRENFPHTRPVILAGNHVAFLEVALMVVYPPYLVELIGTGDIPLDPTFAPLANLYGFIPINRGNLDRAGLKQALTVLEQGGVLGIFPEGGIWQPNQMQAQTGVSWLSSQAQAPIVPIGFGGMRGAINAMLHLKRPQLTMNIGDPIPPIQIMQNGVSRKTAFRAGALHVMERIQALIPAEEQQERKAYSNQRYVLEVVVIGTDGKNIPHPTDCGIKHAPQLAQFLLQPVLLDVFVRNLKRAEVKPLQNLNQAYPAAEILRAVQSISDYLAINRGFLTYRFGMETGLAMHSGLTDLLKLSSWAAQSNSAIQITPMCFYADLNGNEASEIGSQVVENR